MRFSVPVMGYTNIDLSLYDYKGILRWIWVMETHEYMLHYPHNFVIISAQSMGVVTQDWALDYNKNIKSLYFLSNFSFDIKDDNYEYEADIGYCNIDCIKKNKSCGIGKNELMEFLANLTKSNKEYTWNQICLQSSYSDILDITGSDPNFVIPDILYYALFLRKFYVERPALGLPAREKSFLQYHCYEKDETSVVHAKELMENFYVIPGLALLLWLYFPLLIHYLPSSSPKSDHLNVSPQGMFPSHKTPIYFGRGLKKIFCFYTPKNSKYAWILVRLRRILFLLAVSLTSLRLILIYKFAWVIAVFFAITFLYPMYISEYIIPDTRFSFMGWTLPTGLMRPNPDLKEYQLLASIMQERIYLIVDKTFWCFLISKSFESVTQPSRINSNILKMFIAVGKFIILLISGIVVACTYFFIPLPYFLKTLFISFVSKHSTHSQHLDRGSLSKILMCIHGYALFLASLYIVMVTFCWCYAITEYSMFTFIGGGISPTMIYPYFVLVGSIVGAIYLLVHSLHKEYEDIMTTLIYILTSEKKLPSSIFSLDPETKDTSVFELVKDSDEEIESIYTISVKFMHNQNKKIGLLKHDLITTYVSKEMYDFIVETCLPLRRQVAFIIIQIIAIMFFGLVALWVKNVFHLEQKMGTVLYLINLVAIGFVPKLLQFMAYKSYFGKKMDIILKQNIYSALICHLNKLKQHH